jgi:EmrB/QacA subfamily drug resistance transporter
MMGRMADEVAVRYGTTLGRWVILAAVFGSAVVFIDGTVVNVALPALSRELHASVRGLQWILDSYLVTLSAFLLLGGNAGDRYGRRKMFVTGLASFVASSVLCGLAPGVGFLIAARALQGVAGAMLVPSSLSIISSVFDRDDRGRAIGAWSGMAAVAGAVGPLLGGWLVDTASWRLIFFLNVPVATAAAWIALRCVPETRDDGAGPLDVTGAALVSAGIALVCYGLIERSGVAGVAGVAALAAFLAVERRSDHPMLPLSLFASAQFSGANLTTVAVYGAMGAALFLITLCLQVRLGYSALEAGAAFLPFTGLMLTFSARVGGLAQRIGPRLPMTIGPLLSAAGLVLFSFVGPGDSYVTTVLPAVMLFGMGMTTTISPLTTAVLGAVDSRRAGVASAVNNVAARLAGLLGIAVIPTVAGIDTGSGVAGSLVTGYPTALRISAAICSVGAAIAWLSVRSSTPVRPIIHPHPLQACHDACVEVA